MEWMLEFPKRFNHFVELIYRSSIGRCLKSPHRIVKGKMLACQNHEKGGAHWDRDEEGVSHQCGVDPCMEDD